MHKSSSPECEIGHDVVPRSDRYLFFLSAEILLPHSDGVSAGRKIFDCERPIVFRDGKIGMFQNPNIGVHPVMDIAFDLDHDLALRELSIQRSFAWSLAMVPFAIYLGHWMNVVRYGIRVDDV